jgi:hypothetical protein
LALRNISQKWNMPIPDWKAALNRFSIEFEGRVDLPPASRTNVMFVKSVTMENDGHEEEQIYRRTDHWVLAASRSRHADQGVVPQRRF